jgi:hypothetical protein
MKIRSAESVVRKAADRWQDDLYWNARRTDSAVPEDVFRLRQSVKSSLSELFWNSLSIELD